MIDNEAALYGVDTNAMKDISRAGMEAFWMMEHSSRKVLCAKGVYESLFGKSCTNFYEQRGAWNNMIHPEDVIKVHAAHNTDKEYDIEYRLLSEQGYRWVRERGFSLPDNDKVVPKMISILEDVTESKANEQAIRTLNEELETRVKQRTWELEALIVKLLSEIMERKTVEQKLDLTQFSVDKSSDAIFWVNPDAKFSYVNDAACRMFGYSEEELLEMSVIELDVNSKGIEGWKVFWDNIKIKGSMILESRARRKDGSEFIMEVNTNYLKYKDNEFQVTYGRDITKRKEMEKQLREMNSELQKEIEVRNKVEERLRYHGSLIENISDAIISTDLNYNIKSWNTGAESIYGWSEKEALGKDSRLILRTHFTSGDWYEVRKALDEHGVWRGEVIEKCTQGFMHYILSSMTLLKDCSGNSIGIIRVNRDITESKLATIALKKNEAMYKTLVETMQEGLTLVDNNDNLLFANKQFYQMFGYKKEEIEGRNLHDILLDKEDSHFMNHVSALRKEDISSHYEIKLKKNTGERIWTMVSGAPMKDGEGKVIGSIGVHTDISELKAIEQKLKDKIEDLNTFIYRASHDLRAPLASLLGLVNVARNEIKTSKADKFFSLIGDSTRKMDTMLIDLINLTRISHGELSLEEVELDKLVKDVLHELENVEGYNELQVNVQIDPGAHLRTDARILRSVLQNLIDNSLKYRKPGRQDGWMNIRISSNSSNVKIEVTDNGIGINPEFKSRIFDMFFRATLSSTGSGLGLYIVKSAVEKLKGTIQVESEEMKGTSFIITLPV